MKHYHPQLEDSISDLACSTRELVKELKVQNRNQSILHRMEEMERSINMKLSEVKKAVSDAAKKSTEAFAEIGTRIGDLQKRIQDLLDGVGDPEVTDEEFETDLKTLSANINSLADIVPNVEAPAVLTQPQIDALATAGFPLTEQQIADNTAGTGPILTADQVAALAAAGV